jgi:hypothetical protein
VAFGSNVPSDVWNSSIDCDKLEWQQTLYDLGKKLHISPTRMCLMNLTRFGVSKVLLLLVVFCQLLGRDGHYFLSPLGLHCLIQGGFVFFLEIVFVFNLCQ